MMRVIFLAASLVLAATQTSLAESCRERFVKLLIHGNGDAPTKIDITTKPGKGPASKNEFYILKTGHWMTVMIEPASPWTLAYNNTMFTSADKGKTWKKVRTMDSAKNKATNIENQTANSKTVENAMCGEEELDGVMHDTIEADFKSVKGWKSDNHYKYWVNRQTGWISKAVYDAKAKNYAAVTTQVIQSAPDLTLPTPE